MQLHGHVEKGYFYLLGVEPFERMILFFRDASVPTVSYGLTFHMRCTSSQNNNGCCLDLVFPHLLSHEASKPARLWWETFFSLSIPRHSRPPIPFKPPTFSHILSLRAVFHSNGRSVVY